MITLFRGINHQGRVHQEEAEIHKRNLQKWAPTRMNEIKRELD